MADRVPIASDDFCAWLEYTMGLLHWSPKRLTQETHGLISQKAIRYLCKGKHKPHPETREILINAILKGVERRRTQIRTALGPEENDQLWGQIKRLQATIDDQDDLIRRVAAYTGMALSNVAIGDRIVSFVPPEELEGRSEILRRWVLTS